MAAHEKDFQRLRVGAKEKANFQARPAFENVPPQPPDGDSRMEMRPSEAVGQNAQRFFHPAHIRVVQLLEGGQKPQAEQDTWPSHVSTFP
jgi:hypothetical protein